ncbi:MAG: hypothetical protein LQ350_005646 [Teloschistes chrysophthalmus]|nr:MAG: hypothetical protein LQ350_005646 [Niorma chrysophthalma]
MSSTLRSRNPSSKPPPTNPTSPPSPPPKEHEATHDSDSDSEKISHIPSPLDIIRILLTLLLLSATCSYFITTDSVLWGYRPAWTRPARIRAWLRGPLSLTPQTLSLYNGTDSSLPIYLALNSSIYDVTASPHLYGPGGPYHMFAGRDASRAFVTGCFDPQGLVGDLRGVEEMFLPLPSSYPASDDYGDAGAGGEGQGKGKGEGLTKAEVKKRNERERREAKKKVKEAVRGWEGLFDGGKGGRYFWVGRVDRGVGVGWEDGWGERRGLCVQALEGRRRGEGDGGGGGGDGNGNGNGRGGGRIRRAEDVAG